MAQCDDISPLLSALSDGELSALEADHVTRHLDTCEKCKDSLLDFLMLGHHLRSATALPSLDGFTDRVLLGIAGCRRPPRERLGLWLGRLRENWLEVVALGAAGVAAATLALVVEEHVGPRKFAHAWHGPDENAQTEPSPVQSVPENSSTFISRLEAERSSVAMWSEPDTKTTVIWLTDDASEK